ncbi:MAG TPA: DUF2017 family protein [Acidimicrobiales bacterium]|nr:DUF2017 family protein [Acidimicrobiales bacterium]
MFRRRIRPARSRQGCELHLPPEERRLLASLPSQLQAVLDATESSREVPDSLKRLFPPAYVRDDEAQASFREATHSELTASHQAALAVLADSADAARLDEEQMAAWMTALNDLRLVLGTVLQVTDDGVAGDQDPQSSELVIYHYLTMLQSELIDVMERWLPEPVPGADDLVPDDPWGEPLGGLRWDGTPQPTWPPRPEL